MWFDLLHRHQLARSTHLRLENQFFTNCAEADRHVTKSSRANQLCMRGGTLSCRMWVLKEQVNSVRLQSVMTGPFLLAVLVASLVRGEAAAGICGVEDDTVAGVFYRQCSSKSISLLMHYNQFNIFPQEQLGLVIRILHQNQFIAARDMNFKPPATKLTGLYSLLLVTAQ